MKNYTNKVLSFIVVHLLIVFTTINCHSQQLPKYSQYMMNEFVLNPSVAGQDGMTTITGVARKDWFEFGNEMRSPQSVCFSAQTRILKSKTTVLNKNGRQKLKQKSNGRVGLGASFYSENSGAMTITSAQLSYAYHISFYKSQLSFGMSGTMSQINFNSEYIQFYDNAADPMKAIASSPTWFPDFNAGINYVASKFHLGISAHQILQTPVKFGNSEVDYSLTEIGLKRNWNVMGSAFLKIPSSPDWELEPSFLLKMYDLFNFKGTYKGPASQLDLSLKMFYKSKFWIGASYRTMSEIVAMTGLKVNNYYFSYAFDYGFNELIASTLGSHEISFTLKFGDSARRYPWMERY